jgi:hypothetical protein
VQAELNDKQHAKVQNISSFAARIARGYAKEELPSRTTQETTQESLQETDLEEGRLSKKKA